MPTRPPYDLKLTVYFSSYMAIPGYSSSSKAFIVEVKDYCVPLSVTIVDLFVPDAISYTVFED